jgi:hypothetical protein
MDDIIKMKSIGDIRVDDIKSDVAYVKEKEKQAQIVEPLTRRTYIYQQKQLSCLYLYWLYRRMVLQGDLTAEPYE